MKRALAYLMCLVACSSMALVLDSRALGEEDGRGNPANAEAASPEERDADESDWITRYASSRYPEDQLRYVSEVVSLISSGDSPGLSVGECEDLVAQSLLSSEYSNEEIAGLIRDMLDDDVVGGELSRTPNGRSLFLFILPTLEDSGTLLYTGKVEGRYEGGEASFSYTITPVVSDRDGMYLTEYLGIVEEFLADFESIFDYLGNAALCKPWVAGPAIECIAPAAFGYPSKMTLLVDYSYVYTPVDSGSAFGQMSWSGSFALHQIESPSA